MKLNRIMAPVRKIYILLIVILLLTLSCQNRDSRDKSNKLIPESELVPILTDFYIADGLLAFPPVRSHFFEKDSISNYIDILDKRGISKERMDNTMHYYFTKKSKKLEKIYDKVLARLSVMQSELESELPSEDPSGGNLWNLKNKFSVPEEGVQNTGRFNIEISDTGWYALTFNALIFDDDKGINPRTTVYFWHSDATEEGVADYWENLPLIKDGTRNIYIVKKKLTDTAFTHIRGMLYNHDPQPARWEKHARFSEIVLRKGRIE